MEIEHITQASAPNVRARSIAQAPPPEMDELDNAPNRGLNLRSVGRTIQRQALLIAGIATIVAVAASFQAMKIRPTYKGDFQLLVEPVTNAGRATDPLTVTRSQGDAIPSDDIFQLDYPTQIKILQSPGMLNSITQEVQTQYPDFTLGQLQTGLLVSRLVPENAAPNDATRIIQVTYEDADSALVQQVLKVTADRYLRYSLEERKTRFGEGIKFIDDQLPEAQQRVSSIQDQIQQLQQRYDLIDVAAQGGQLSQQIDDINTLKQQTARELQEQKTLYNNLYTQIGRLSPQAAIAASALSEDPTYQTLQANLAEVENQIATESVRFNEDSPVLKSLQDRKSEILELLSKRVRQVTGQQIAAEQIDSPESSAAIAYQNSVRISLIGQLVEAGNQIQMLEVRNREIDRAQRGFEQRLSNSHRSPGNILISPVN